MTDAEQNSYQMSCSYESERWSGHWIKSDWSDWMETADNWQDAAQKGIDGIAPVGSKSGLYQVLSETPSGEGRSGIIDIQFDPPRLWRRAKVRANIIEDN